MRQKQEKCRIMNILLIFLAMISNIAAISTGAFLLSVIPGMNIFTYSLAYAADIAILAAISFTTQRLLGKIFFRDAGGQEFLSRFRRRT